MLVPAIITITLVLVLYSIGIWGELIQGILKPWQAVFFTLGLAADTTGTLMMTRLSAARADAGVSADGLSTVMAVSGTIAIALMAVHLVWAIVVLVRGRRSEKMTFHRFSLVVWAIWLIPYVVGAIVAMTSG